MLGKGGVEGGATSDQNPLASKILKTDSHRKHDHSTLEDFSLASPVTAELNPSNSATSTVVRRDETGRIIFGFSSRASGHP